jgi:hypothetical protein
MHGIHPRFQAHRAAFCALIWVLEEKNDFTASERAQIAVHAMLRGDFVRCPD